MEALKAEDSVGTSIRSRQQTGRHAALVIEREHATGRTDESSVAPEPALEKRSGVYDVRLLALLASDVLIVLCVNVLAWISSEKLRLMLLDGGVSSIPSDLHARFLMLVMPILLLIGMSYSAGHYTRLRPMWLETKEFLKISVYTISCVSIALYLTDGHFSRLWFISFWSPIVVLVPLSRLLTKRLLMRQGKWFRPVAIFGVGLNALRSAKAIESEPMLGLRVDCFVRTMPSDECVARVPAERVVELDDWAPDADDDHPERPHLLFAPDSTEEFERNRMLLNRLSSCSRSITFSPPFNGLPLDGAEVVNIPRSDAVLLRLQNNLAKRHAAFLKRVFDVLAAAFGLLLLVTVLAPVVALLLVAIRRDGGPAFYRQRRVGKNGVAFGCWKLRSMVVNADEALAQHLEANPEARREWEASQKLKDDPRVTPVGQFIRATSIDELPQLWNVLKGDMSMVGPRPIPFDGREGYGHFLSYYLNHKPGITGLWQISGRSDTTYERRVDLDVWYSRNWSFWLDLVILARTLPTVLKGSGAY